MGKRTPITVAVLALALLLSGSVYAQEDAKPAVAPGVGGELNVQFMSFIPGINVNVVAPLNFGSDSITLTPYAGFSYFFSVMEDVHDNFYIPLGVKLLFNKLGLGFRFDYGLSLERIFVNGLVDLSVFGYFPLVKKEHFGLALAFDVGGSLLYGTYGVKLLFQMRPALSAWYAF